MPEVNAIFSQGVQLSIKFMHIELKSYLWYAFVVQKIFKWKWM